MNKKIVVCGASGDLGRRITGVLLEKIAPSDLTLVTRTPAKLAHRAAQGVRVQPGDYRNPEALERAFGGGDTLMLISGLDVTHRIPQHRNAINAAKKVGIKHIVYTSVAGIHPRNPTLSATDHIVTENDLLTSGLGFTILRDATYSEILATLPARVALATGKLPSAAGEGQLAPVSKDDVMRCAAACLLDPEFHNGAVYEISGPELLSFRDLAALIAETYGVPVEYVPITAEQKLAQLDAMGVARHYDANMTAHPDMQMWASDELVSADIAWAQNYHAIVSRHVEFITGRKPRTLRDVFESCKGKTYEESGQHNS